ncbi:response regulator [Paenibacillus sp. FJAT-26967]|uniref:response regulator n=1 Tax=Paenibacillus sp. FJAT-26967 TaxID=1729690 RepID=UPI000837E059|nr:response regulator [Paenibacillus sp. FJAT-26967]
MYQVLLADDEYLDLEGLRAFIPWERLGLHVVGAVNNGFDAVKLMEQEKVDILVTDVRMPSMTGLELARQALEKYTDLRIIFVSGHQDFAYVKEALSLKACSYVLKPMDDSEMIQSLEAVIQDLDRDQKRRKTERAFEQMRPIVHNEYVFRLLEGTADRQELDELLAEEGLKPVKFPVRAAVLETDDLSWKLNPYTAKERQDMLNDFGGNLIDLCTPRGINHTCRISKQRLGLLITSDESGYEILKQVIEHVKSNFPFTITIGLGGAADSPTALQESYREALTALDTKMFYGKGKILESGVLRDEEIADAKLLEYRLDALFAATVNYDLVAIYDEIDHLFSLAVRLRSRFTIINFATYIIVKLDGYLQSMNEQFFSMLGMELQNLDIILQFETIDDIRDWLRRKLFEISERLRMSQQNKNRKLIRDMMDYVKEKLADNVTLRDVADRFSFSPNYLGHVFKEETGQNFSDFVISLRMEKAKELLGDPTLKIYEVADRIGYRYLPYFSRQFKETFGMTPMQYRRNH